MKMKNKTTKLRTHTSSKKGRKFRKEKSAILFFNNPQFVSKKITIPCFAGRYIHFPSLQNLNNVEIRGLTRLIILLKMK